jgi:hypothetical protein
MLKQQQALALSCQLPWMGLIGVVELDTLSWLMLRKISFEGVEKATLVQQSTVIAATVA